MLHYAEYTDFLCRFKQTQKTASPQRETVFSASARTTLSVKRRIESVEILGIKIILYYAEAFAEIINLSKCLETPLFTGFRALSFMLGF